VSWWGRACLWLHKPQALVLEMPPRSPEMAAWRRRVLLSITGFGLTLAAALGLVALTGWAWGWLGMGLVLAGMLWVLTSSEARILVLPYLQLMERAYALENLVYVADSKAGQARLAIGDITGTEHKYTVWEINVGAGLDWNTETGRQNLAATILADALSEQVGTETAGQRLAEQLVKHFAPLLAVFLFRREEKGQVRLRENFATTRQKVINFVAAKF
jgi:hypothetical protein